MLAWQEALREGREGAVREAAKSLKSTLMELGQQKFGTSASAEMMARLALVEDLTWFDTRLKRILDAKSWEELLH